MKKNTRKRSSIKLAIIAACSLVILVVILCLSAYLVMHRYISKVNYVPLEEANSSTTQFLQDEEVLDSIDDFTVKRHNSSGAKTSLRSQEAVTALSESSIEAGIGTIPSVPYEDDTAADVPDSPDIPTDEVQTSKDGEVTMKVLDHDEESLLEERIRKNIRDNSDLGRKEDDVLNLLLICTDNRSEEDQGLSDSLLLLSINENTRKITTVSLRRNIYLYVPEKNTFNRLNASFAYGGARLLIKTIEENFKIKIDKYASVDFYSFIEVIDSLGGIELKITVEELPHVNDLMNELNRIQGKIRGTDYLKEPGVQQMNGRQALGYARVRYVGTDFGRTARQRKIMEQIFKKIKGLGIKQTTQLLDILLPQVTTNFTEKEIISLILSLSEYMEYDYASFGIPMEGTYENMKIRGRQILAIDFEENIKELRRLIYIE